MYFHARLRDIWQWHRRAAGTGVRADSKTERNLLQVGGVLASSSIRRGRRVSAGVEKYGTDSLPLNWSRGRLEISTGEAFEIGLHLHLPQWCNAYYEQSQWRLDYDEYNLCVLPRPRIERIIQQSLDYLRGVLGEPGFTPVAFRAGNWLFQPTEAAASVLAEKGIRIDSSVFKGGLQHHHGLDYRPAAGNRNYWSFAADVNSIPIPGARWSKCPSTLKWFHSGKWRPRSA